MIKVSELRIGNFIYDDEGIIAKVIGFRPYDHSVRCDEEEGCDVSVNLYPQDGKVRRALLVESSLINPIPLSNEWLERCGFEPVENGIRLELNEPYQELSHMFNKMPLCLGVDNVRMPLPHIQYVHQLQNLYFALTGEELEVRL